MSILLSLLLKIWFRRIVKKDKNEVKNLKAMVLLSVSMIICKHQSFRAVIANDTIQLRIVFHVL